MAFPGNSEIRYRDLTPEWDNDLLKINFSNIIAPLHICMYDKVANTRVG